MVQATATEIEAYQLSAKYRPSMEGEQLSKNYSDMICVTKAPKVNNPTRYFRSTYDFSSQRRFKTVVRLEPTLAPIRYYRTINYGIPRDLRHKSTVDCDFRPRARSFSETTWIFPKQGRDIYVSTLERNQLVDTTWYKSKVNITSATDSKQEANNGHTSDAEYPSTASDEETTPQEEITTPQKAEYASSSSSDEERVINNNYHNKPYCDSIGESIDDPDDPID